MSELIVIKNRGKRKASFLDTSLRLEGITELLEICVEQPKSFSELFKTSRFRFKQSYIKYLKYCKTQGFLEHKYTPMRQMHAKYSKYLPKKAFLSIHLITDKGRQFLELVN